MGQELLEDDERPGRPVEVITEDKVALVEELVLNGRRLKVKEIAEITKLSDTTVRRILHDHLGMQKKMNIKQEVEANHEMENSAFINPQCHPQPSINSIESNDTANNMEQILKPEPFELIMCPNRNVGYMDATKFNEESASKTEYNSNSLLTQLCIKNEIDSSYPAQMSVKHEQNVIEKQDSCGSPQFTNIMVKVEDSISDTYSDREISEGAATNVTSMLQIEMGTKDESHTNTSCDIPSKG
nr:unnamed protein product [Callosobruchus analis]